MYPAIKMAVVEGEDEEEVAAAGPGRKVTGAVGMEQTTGVCCGEFGSQEVCVITKNIYD